MVTQIGSGKIVIRYKTTTGHEIRLLEPFETMKLIGWDVGFWSEGTEIAQSDKGCDLVVNMSGNAFCFAHFLPVFIATLSVFGRYSVDDLEKDPAVVDAEDVVDFDKAAASSSG